MSPELQQVVLDVMRAVLFVIQSHTAPPPPPPPPEPPRYERPVQRRYRDRRLAPAPQRQPRDVSPGEWNLRTGKMRLENGRMRLEPRD